LTCATTWIDLKCIVSEINHDQKAIYLYFFLHNMTGKTTWIENELVIFISKVWRSV
jgi:hypothetical protein